MSPCLKARCNHNIDACLFQREGFIRRGRRSERDDTFHSCLVQYLFRWNTVDERKGGNAGIEKHARLILKSHRLVWCKCRLCAAERFDVWREM